MEVGKGEGAKVKKMENDVGPAWHRETLPTLPEMAQEGTEVVEAAFVQTSVFERKLFKVMFTKRVTNVTVTTEC